MHRSKTCGVKMLGTDDIDPIAKRIIEAVIWVMNAGWGSVTIEIRNGEVISIEKKITSKLN